MWRNIREFLNVEKKECELTILLIREKILPPIPSIQFIYVIYKPRYGTVAADIHSNHRFYPFK